MLTKIENQIYAISEQIIKIRDNLQLNDCYGVLPTKQADFLSGFQQENFNRYIHPNNISENINLLHQTASSLLAYDNHAHLAADLQRIESLMHILRTYIRYAQQDSEQLHSTFKQAAADYEQGSLNHQHLIMYAAPLLITAAESYNIRALTELVQLAESQQYGSLVSPEALSAHQDRLSKLREENAHRHRFFAANNRINDFDEEDGFVIVPEFL